MAITEDEKPKLAIVRGVECDRIRKLFEDWPIVDHIHSESQSKSLPLEMRHLVSR